MRSARRIQGIVRAGLDAFRFRNPRIRILEPWLYPAARISRHGGGVNPATLLLERYAANASRRRCLAPTRALRLCHRALTAASPQDRPNKNETFRRRAHGASPKKCLASACNRWLWRWHGLRDIRGASFLAAPACRGTLPRSSRLRSGGNAYSRALESVRL